MYIKGLTIHKSWERYPQGSAYQMYTIHIKIYLVLIRCYILYKVTIQAQ